MCQELDSIRERLSAIERHLERPVGIRAEIAELSKKLDQLILWQKSIMKYIAATSEELSAITGYLQANMKEVNALQADMEKAKHFLRELTNYMQSNTEVQKVVKVRIDTLFNKLKAVPPPAPKPSEN